MKDTQPTLRFGVVSDLHATDRTSNSVSRKSLRWFRDCGADAVVVAGDLTDHGLLPQFGNADSLL